MMLSQIRSWLRALLLVSGALLVSALTLAPVASAKDKDSSDSAKAKHEDKDDDDRDDDDDCVLTFATVGDSRQDPVAPDPTTLPLSGQDKIWLQNTKAWSRMIRSIQDEHANFLFFNGDMIMGYGKAGLPADTTTVNGIVHSDLMDFYRQYGFWRGMVAGLMETGTYVVPVPGNHETQSKPLGKIAQVENEDAWRANMGDLILDTDRFQALFGEGPSNTNTSGLPNLDSLSTSQSQLSYSFDFRGSHFVVINTDPVGKDSHAPVKWLEDDLSAAKTRGAKHFFVFGHKPAFTYYYGSVIPAPPALPLPGKVSGLDVDTTARDSFWAVIEKYGASYWCGHEHIFHISQPTAATGGHSYQFLVGTGGSPFEAAPADATVSSTDRTYAWAYVRVLKSGKVKVTAYGFDDDYGPTKKLQTLTLPN